MSRPKTLRVSSATWSPWIPVAARHVAGWVAGVGVKLSSGANLTYTVQHTHDNIQANTPCSISRSTTTATLTLANHGLSVGDYIKVQNAGAPLDGEFAVASVVDANSITYTVANSGATASAPQATVTYARVFSHSTLAAQTASGEGNYVAPCNAIRLNVSSYTGGFADITVTQAGA